MNMQDPSAMIGLMQMLMGQQQQMQSPQGGFDQISSALQQLLSRRMQRAGIEESFAGQELNPDDVEAFVRMLMMQSPMNQEMPYGDMGGDMGYGPAQIGMMI